MRSHQTSSRLEEQEVGLAQTWPGWETGLKPISNSGERGVTLKVNDTLMVSYRHCLKPTPSGGFKSNQSSPRLGRSMDMACDRKAGKGVSGVRAAEGIGECGYALVSVSLTTRGTGCRSAYPEDHSSSAGAGTTGSSEISEISSRCSTEHLIASTASMGSTEHRSWPPTSDISHAGSANFGIRRTNSSKAGERRIER